MLKHKEKIKSIREEDRKAGARADGSNPSSLHIQKPYV